jgi:collagenase-like PrtC family protease
MKLSVACNFDDALLQGLAGYPVYEVYGKLTTDYFGGGRPAFYLPEVNCSRLARTVKTAHASGIQFNYLLNASAMSNTEYTRTGQRKMDEMLDWVDGIGVDSITVANVYFLRLIRRRHPRLKVRVSSHRFTDNPRKVRFWVDQGADVIVVSEVGVHREFETLAAMKEAAQGVALQLIVNNWCRQDCAIAGNHAVALSAASQAKNKGFPLDYCSILCNQIRLREPVNYVRANWIRPEDLHYYEKLGYDTFKIVERNTPTQILLERVKAYSERRYDGNLLDLVQNYAYPKNKLGTVGKDASSLRRMIKYFVKPFTVNLFHFRKLVDFGRAASMLYPREGENPVVVDNRALDGFLERFAERGCQSTDCESCRYCHQWAARAVKIDPSYKTKLEPLYDDLLGDIDAGAFWEPYTRTVAQALRRRKQNPNEPIA